MRGRAGESERAPRILLAAGRAFQFVQLQVPAEGHEVTRETFQFRVDKKKLQAAEWRDGHYLLRSNLTAGDPSVLWARYGEPA